MNRYVLFLGILFFISVASAEVCSPNVTLINQDPYPAVPGDYVKLVFQIENIANSECGDITFKLIEDYPLIFDPGENGLRTFRKVEYIQDFNDNILVPYKVRVDSDALEGSTPIEAYIQSRGSATVSKTFDIEIEDTRADFEVFVDEYLPATRELTFQILNTGDSDIEALTVTIPKQDGITVKGTNKIIAGDLDSNEYTTVTFEAEPTDGTIELELTYSDTINTRRSESVSVNYDSEYFGVEQNTSVTGVIGSIVVTLLLILVLLLLIYLCVWVIKRIFKRSKK